MRWKTVSFSILAATLLTGCPHAFLKRDGTVDRAARKDTEESFETPECTEELYDEICAGGKEESEECLRICGG